MVLSGWDAPFVSTRLKTDLLVIGLHSDEEEEGDTVAEGVTTVREEEEDMRGARAMVEVRVEAGEGTEGVEVEEEGEVGEGDMAVAGVTTTEATKRCLLG